MRKFYISLVFLFLGFFLQKTQAQSNIKDSSVFAPMLYVTYAYQWPGGDLKDRFGSNSNIGGGFQFKLKNNWILGADFNYMFGNKIKDTLLFSDIETAGGYIINNNGEYTDVYLYERGYYTSFRFGKLFPVLSPNPNSGPFIMGSVGFLQHKIRIENPGNTAPQISGDYRKGYDKLTSGLGISEFIGYMYLGNKRLISFYAGVEFIQAFTQSRRTYDFNLGGYDATKRVDLQYGIKVGWIIPFYKRRPAGYYYN